MKPAIDIDGSFGEGGGQILRSSLALGVATKCITRVFNIRAGRKKPGLLRQHLTALRAAAQVSGASVTGDELGSREIVFEPAGIFPGSYHFSVGSAGSATLVLQTVLPVLLLADGPSEVRIEGGTHNPMAPPFDFLTGSFLPLLERLGAKVDARLERAGYFLAGGGLAVFRIEPVPEHERKRRLDLVEPGPLQTGRGRILLSKLPDDIGVRESKTIARKMNWESRIERPPSPGPGNVVLVEADFVNARQVFAGFGQKGVSAETVAGGVCKRARRFLGSGAAVDEYLADQLLLPMALLGGGSFTSESVSEHTRTNIEVIRRFVERDINITAEPRRFRIDVV